MAERRHIPFSEPFIDEAEIAEVTAVLRGKWITSGPEVGRFERAVKKYLQVECAVALNSCTAALEIALAAQGVGPGDEVITTPMTFVSTVGAIVQRGARPVLADVEPDTGNLDPAAVTALIEREYSRGADGWVSRRGGRLRGMVVVHYGGQPAEMAEFNRIARRFGLFVVEDAAHALGARQFGLPIGHADHLVCFSFYSNKNITTGEGGMLVCRGKEMEETIRRLSLHGLTRDNLSRYTQGLPYYDVEYPGFKANMSDVLAALGVAQMRKLKRITRRRQTIAGWYDSALAGTPGLELPSIRPHNESARHLYPVLLADELAGQRDRVLRGLHGAGIQPSVHFIPVHHFTFYRNYFGADLHLPQAERFFRREISLPLYPGLKRADVTYTAGVLKTILRGL